MQGAGLPRIDIRYWTILLLASICGTNIGDFASQTLRLGFFAASLPFAVLFAAVLPGIGRKHGEPFYWVAIVIARAGATDIADLASHQLGLRVPALLVSLLALLAAILIIGARHNQATLVATGGAFSSRGPAASWRENAPDLRPASNATYWASMVVTSVLGTLTGDYLADDLGLGLFGSVLATAPLAGLAALSFGRPGRLLKPHYWLAVFLIRTAATNLGDLVAGTEGLHLGFLAGALGAFALGTLAVLAWRPHVHPEALRPADRGLAR